MQKEDSLTNARIYAPNLNRVFEAFDNWCNRPVSADAIKDDYLSALLQLGIMTEKDSLYVAKDEWQLMSLSGSRRAKSFKKKLTDMTEVKTILNELGDEGRTSEELENRLYNAIPADTVRTLIAWLEAMEVIQLKEKKYKLSEDEEDEEDQRDYPSINESVNIKEDKYSIFEYLRKLKKGDIMLSPDFQRHVVWKPEQKSKFIESVLMGLPLPPIYLKKDSDTKYIVVDGLQRSSTLRDFMEGKLVLTGLEPEDKNILNNATVDTLDDLKDGLRARIEDRQLFVYVMEPSVPMSVVYDVFNRINTGGTQLSRQEIRNCIFQGRSTLMLKTIAEDKTFKDSIDHGIQELRMKDREAVLRCLAFVVLNYELDYDGSMDKFMEKAMTKINKMPQSKSDDLERCTLNVFSLTSKIFGDANFRIPTDYTRGRINIAVMESVFNCFYQKKNRISINSTQKQKLTMAFKNLLADERFLGAVRWSTGSMSQVKTRFRLAHDAFDSLL